MSNQLIDSVTNCHQVPTNAVHVVTRIGIPKADQGGGGVCGSSTIRVQACQLALCHGAQSVTTTLKTGRHCPQALARCCSHIGPTSAKKAGLKNGAQSSLPSLFMHVQYMLIIDGTVCYDLNCPRFSLTSTRTLPSKHKIFV